MKTIIKTGVLGLILGLAIACTNSQTASGTHATKTASFKVWGNCDMCKETIEGSLKVDGIATADWNKDTKLMSVAFDSTKISLDQIEKNVASVGYDTELHKGDDKAYAGLPECCQYERK